MGRHFEEAIHDLAHIDFNFTHLAEVSLFDEKKHSRLLMAYKQDSQGRNELVSLDYRNVPKILEDATIIKRVSTFQIKEDVEYLLLCSIAHNLLRHMNEMEDAERAYGIFHRQLKKEQRNQQEVQHGTNL